MRPLLCGRMTHMFIYVMHLLGYTIISIVNCNWNDAEYSTLIKLALYSLTAAVQ